MLIDVPIFVVGFALGGLFVFRGMRTAIKRELSKPPLSEEEQDERARQLVAKARSEMSPNDDKRTTEGIDAARTLIESIEARATADGNRLWRMLGEVKDRIGEAPFCIVDGQALVHPELQRELSKPGNEALSEMLVSMARRRPKGPE